MVVMVVAVVVPAAPGALVVGPLGVDGPALAVEVAVQDLPVVPGKPVMRQPLALAPELLLLVLEAVGTHREWRLPLSTPCSMRFCWLW